MRTLACFILLVLLSAVPSAVTAQVCGDASGDGDLDLIDVAATFDYLMGYGPGVSPQGDCDGIGGVTMSDAVTIIDYLFNLQDRFDCTLEGSYSFAASFGDTVYLPRVLSVPDDINTVAMPVITVMGSDVGGAYLPVLKHGLMPDGRFALVDVILASFVISASNASWQFQDTLVMLCAPVNLNSFAGTKEVFSLIYERQAPGSAEIIPFPIDRADPLRFAVEKDGDLLVPHITWYDYQVPPDTVSVDQTPVDIIMTVADPQGQPQAVPVTSSPSATACSTIVHADWIVVTNPGVHTTPFDVEFEINPDGLAAGNYSGAIEVVPVDPLVAAPESDISVSLTLNPLILYPWGDLNCDGQATLTDLTLMIGVLFLGWDTPELCGQ